MDVEQVDVLGLGQVEELELDVPGLGEVRPPDPGVLEGEGVAVEQVDVPGPAEGAFGVGAGLGAEGRAEGGVQEV